MPESLFNKFAGLKPAALLKKRLAWVFSVSFAKYLRATCCSIPPVAASVYSSHIVNILLYLSYVYIWYVKARTKGIVKK